MPLIRAAAVAGRFYPRSAAECRRVINEFPTGPADAATVGIVPHAGWTYSGATAWRTLTSIAASQPETVVIFGAVHVVDRNLASLFPAGAWDTPFGAIPVDAELSAALAKLRDVAVDPGAHASEHSIEVVLPLLGAILPAVRIIAIMVRATDRAAEIGRRCAEGAVGLGRRVAFVASTDLTHYGPWFGFEPAGRGASGVRWAKEVNDRRFITLLNNVDIPGVVPEAAVHRNACGAGAAAAALAAAKVLGATKFRELEHTSSAEVQGDAEFENSVGYLSGVF